MQLRAIAFLTRSVRQDSRLMLHHVMRAAMPLMILYLFFVQLQMFSRRAAAGGEFASTIVYCCYWFLTLVGGIHFSTAIVEEKEEQTLPLLKMTGATSFAILAGKSLPRLAVAVLFLCVTAPFLILSITLGGVLPLGLVSAILGILCYAVMLSQLGLFASVVCRTPTQAFTVLCLLWLAFELCPWWPDLTLIGNLEVSLLSFSTLAPADAEVSFIASALTWVRSLWSLQMTFHLVVAGFFFVLSWALFERCTAEASGDAVVADETRAADRRFVSRAWEHATAWKSWQFVSGGTPWFWLRTIVGTFSVFFAAIMLATSSGSSTAEEVAMHALWIGCCFFLINMARLFGKVLNEEIHGKTLASLVMLPQATSETLWGLVSGILPGVLAGGVGAVLAFGMSVLVSGIDLGDLLEVLFQPWIWHFFSWTILTVHVGLLLTTHLRYGGMLLGVLLVWFVVPMLCIASLALLSFGGGGRGAMDFMQYLVPLGLIVAEGLICVGLQKSLVQRIEELASR